MIPIPGQAEYNLVAALFDIPFYLHSYPDIRDAGLDPISHYLKIGWKEGRDPSPTFSTTAYLQANPDVREAGICPLVEYITSGIIAGRPLRPELSTMDPALQRIAAAFNAAYYLQTYPEVASSGVDPLVHYFEIGWRMYLNPSADFDSSYYLESNPDVQASGICPLLHYVDYGAVEGRLPSRPGALLREIINSAVVVEERVKPWLCLSPVDPVDGLTLREALAKLVRSHVSGIVISLSQDDYVAVAGGVQNCVGDDERAFQDDGWTFLHLRPAQPLPVLAPNMPSEQFFVWLRANGAQIGTVSLATLIDEIGRLRPGMMRRILLIHHLMGFSPELVAEFAHAFAPDQSIVWVHDMFTLCPSWAMLRNNVAFCGGPRPDSQACGICVYGGPERILHLTRLELLFDALRPNVLSPSQTALNFWLARSPMKYSRADIVPHGRLLMSSESPPGFSSADLHLRIGFVGDASFHKGWHVFSDLAQRHHRDPRYSFFQFGTNRPCASRNVTFLPIKVDATHRHRMIDGLIANRIDVVVNWSRCYETFCFAAYEAVAAGAFVIAPNKAGNIVPAISQNGVEQGLGLDTEDELFKLFATGEIFDVITNRHYGEFHIEAATFRHLMRSD